MLLLTNRPATTPRVVRRLVAVIAMVAAACSDDPVAPPSASVLQLASTSEQTVSAGAVAPTPPRVRALTETGIPVAGVRVAFSAAGGGSVASASALSDAQGYATADTWRVGTRTDRNELTASLAMGASVTFGATVTPGPVAQLAVVTPPSLSTHAGEVLRQQPVVQLRDVFGNDVPQAGVPVSATIAQGTATLTNATATTNATGLATFAGLTVHGTAGSYGIAFSGLGVSTAVNAMVSMVPALCNGGRALILDMALGSMVRYSVADSEAPRCLEFDGARTSGQQYLVMFENMPRVGEREGGLFPGPPTSSAFSLKVSASPVGVAPPAPSRLVSLRAAAVMADQADEGGRWDFGGGVIQEGTPTLPAGASGMARLVSTPTSSARASLRSAVPAVGDTIEVLLEGVPRLNIARGMQKAVVRFVSADLVFADDIRLGTSLTRENGMHNTPLTVAQMDTIAREYASMAKVQADVLFEGRHNLATQQTERVIAVSTMMYQDNIWGYTYSVGNYFAFDYWVRTDGRTPGSNQVPQRVADNLFMHEIAHMRHWGLLERANRTGVRGNTWLVEGFARFSERLPIAHRLLGAVAPSRTSNFVLARNPAFGTSYFFDDVPTYLDGGSAFFGGYSASSYIFDYLADQVALSGGDPMLALRDIVLHGGVESDLTAALSRWLPGVTPAELVTRARIALYADDYDVAGLPAWTQYHQYQLRSSRPASSQIAKDKDPRNAWPRIVPGVAYADSIALLNGMARGYLVDGTAGSARMTVSLDPVAGSNGVVSVTRIR